MGQYNVFKGSGVKGSVVEVGVDKANSVKDFGCVEVSSAYTFMDLCRDIREDWVNHEKDWTLPGFRAIAICRFGQWRMGITWFILRAPLSVFYRMLYRRARNVYGIELPYTVKLGRGVVIEHQGAIVVHGHAEIGDQCVLRQGVTLGNRYLEKPHEAPKLGKRVNVGAGAKLMGDITVGDDVSIGANAVVIHNIPSKLTVVGIPAKPINKE